MRQLFGILLFTTSPAWASAINQHDVNHTYRFLLWINALFFVAIFMAMSVFIFKNRKMGLDLIWSMIPALMLIVIVGLGWVSFRNNHSGETFYAVKFSQ